MRKINSIFIHHSASNFGNADLIDKWHKEQGWQGIGYHFVVLNGYPTADNFKKKELHNDMTGYIQQGRNIKEAGSHVKGHNASSIGICLIHDTMPYAEKQLEAYRTLAAGLALLLNIDPVRIFGHYEFDKGKPLCPGLDMSEERKLIAEQMLTISPISLDLIKTRFIDN